MEHHKFLTVPFNLHNDILRLALISIFKYGQRTMKGINKIFHIRQVKFMVSLRRFLGQTAQGAPQLTESGKYVVDITDTMLDIISNLGGAVLFLAHYIAHKVSKKSLLMGAIVKDFNQKPEPETAKETAEQA